MSFIGFAMFCFDIETKAVLVCIGTAIVSMISSDLLEASYERKHNKESEEITNNMRE